MWLDGLQIDYWKDLEDGVDTCRGSAAPASDSVSPVSEPASGDAYSTGAMKNLLLKKRVKIVRINLELVAENRLIGLKYD